MPLYDSILTITLPVKTLSVKSDEFFVRWGKYLPIKNFTISQNFWNLFRTFIFFQVAQKYRPSWVRINVWPTVNTYVVCKIPVELWVHRIFSFPYILWDINYKSWHCSCKFSWLKRNNQRHENKALRNGILWDPLFLPVMLHNKIHYPPSPLGALRNGWMIPKVCTMKQQKII